MNVCFTYQVRASKTYSACQPFVIVTCNSNLLLFNRLDASYHYSPLPCAATTLSGFQTVKNVSWVWPWCKAVQKKHPCQRSSCSSIDTPKHSVCDSNNTSVSKGDRDKACPASSPGNDRVRLHPCSCGAELYTRLHNLCDSC